MCHPGGQFPLCQHLTPQGSNPAEEAWTNGTRGGIRESRCVGKQVHGTGRCGLSVSVITALKFPKNLQRRSTKTCNPSTKVVSS